MSTARIRLGTPADLARLDAVERDAAARFPPSTLPPELAEPLPPEVLLAGISRSMLWVAAREDDLAIGFLLAQRQDASIHILEMDVMTEYAGHGIGTALLATVSQFAVAQGARFITLTTFEHLPWNAPFYAKRGFSPVKDISAFPHLAAALGREAASGLMNRVAMVKHELAEEVSQAREMGGRLDHRATSP